MSQPTSQQIRQRRYDFTRATGKEPLRLYISHKLFESLVKEADAMMRFDLTPRDPKIYDMRIYFVCNDENHLEVV